MKSKIVLLVLVIFTMGIVILKAQDDMATIYIIRKSGMGFALKFPIDMDGERLCEIGAKKYIEVKHASGTVHLFTKSENKSELELEVEAGKTYYVLIEVKMGALSARVRLIPIEEEEGIKYISKLKQQ